MIHAVETSSLFEVLSLLISVSVTNLCSFEQLLSRYQCSISWYIYRCLFPSVLEVLYICVLNSCDHVSVTGTEVYSVVQQIVPVMQLLCTCSTSLE